MNEETREQAAREGWARIVAFRESFPVEAREAAWDIVVRGLVLASFELLAYHAALKAAAPKVSDN